MAEITDNTPLPRAFLDEMATCLGAETAHTLEKSLDSPPETSVRLNVRKAASQTDIPVIADGDADRVPWCRSGYYLSERPKFTLDPLLHAGAYYVQDASSMVYQKIVEDLADGEPMTVADLCAAPGGKTTAIINALPEGSTVLANEFTASRAKVLKENLCKNGYPGVVVTNTEVSRLAALGPRFDIVAVDAPCSGEGMMRKEPEARSQWSKGLVVQCSALQREILADAAGLVRPGGYLLYSTCTFNTAEDEDNAAWIRDELGLTPVCTGLAGSWGILPQAKGEVPSLRFMPGFTRGEGLFVGVFRKGEVRLGERGKGKGELYRGKRKGERGMFWGKGKGEREIIREWVKGDFEIRAFDGRIAAYTPGVARLVDEMPKDVRILTAGVELAEEKGRDLIPVHALAMSTAFAHPFPKAELSRDEAVAYLMREPVALPADTPKGYVTVTYGGLPLGFLKNIGTRSNNLYPASWRILHR